MTALLLALLILSALTLCAPGAAQSRAEIRAAANTGGWRVIAPASRHLAVQALRLLVEVLRLVVNVLVFTGQVLMLAAGLLEGRGA